MINTPLDGKLLIAVAVICCCLGGAYDSYEELYKATPDYSLHRIRQTAGQADADRLKDQVDEEKIAAALFHGLLQFRDGQPHASALQKITWLPLQNEITDSLKCCLDHALIPSSSDTDAVQHAQSVLANQLQSLGMPLPTTGWRITSVSWSRRIDDTHAEITLYLAHPVLPQAIPCTIAMERTAPKEWHITNIVHAAAMFQALQQAYLQALETENAPIHKKIDAVLEITDVSSSLVRGDDPDHVFLRMQYTPVFHQPRQDILEAKGVYELRRRTDHVLLFTAPLRLSLSSHATTRLSQFRLNPHIPAQENLADRETLAETESTLRLTSVTLRDGTTYALQTTLAP